LEKGRTMKLNPSWKTAGILAAAGLLNQCRKNAGEFIRIQTAIAYLRGVEILRDLFLYQLGILVCVVFLVFGVILIEGTLIFYLPLQTSVRVFAGLCLGVFDSLTALGFLVYFLSSARWLRQAEKYHDYLEEFMDQARDFSGNGHRKKHRNPTHELFK